MKITDCRTTVITIKVRLIVSTVSIRWEGQTKRYKSGYLHQRIDIASLIAVPGVFCNLGEAQDITRGSSILYLFAVISNLLKGVISIVALRGAIGYTNRHNQLQHYPPVE